MLNALFWGAIASSSLILGGLIASWFTLGRRTLGIIMAFGAGALICAVAYELVFEAVKLARGSGFPGMGFLAGALTFFFSDRLIEKISTRNDTDLKGVRQSGLIIPMVLAIILDGIPESIVIGLGILEKGAVSLSMLLAVFISNLPEAIAATTGMKSGGWGQKKVFLIWTGIALLCALSTVAGFQFFADTSVLWLAFINAFAGGAILTMLCNSMIPEAYEHGGKLAGIFTVLGFALSVSIILLEKS
jgi:ZIP family zinc transporter